MARGQHYYTESLLKLYEEINKVCFNNELPSCRNLNKEIDLGHDVISVYWNTGLKKTLGYYKFRFHPETKKPYMFRIEINTCYNSPSCNLFRFQLTMIHEMCHVNASILTGRDCGHNSIFKNELIRASRLWSEYLINNELIVNFMDMAVANASRYNDCHEVIPTYKYLITCECCGFVRKMKNRTHWVNSLISGNIVIHRSSRGFRCDRLMKVEKI